MRSVPQHHARTAHLLLVILEVLHQLGLLTCFSLLGFCGWVPADREPELLLHPYYMSNDILFCIQFIIITQ